MLYDLLISPFAEFEFMRRALVGVLALAVGAGPIGVFLMLRRMSLVGDAMAHAVLPGAALGFLISGLNIFAMTAGGMLAGHDQAEEKIVEVNGKKYVAFYGMSSDTAMKRHKGGVAEYRASEGKTVKIPHKGDVSASLQDILGGLRSACTYVGARKLKELSKRTTFIRVSQQLNTVFGNE